MQTVAFDTETRGLRWYVPEEHAFLVTWATDQGEWWADLGEADQTARFLTAIDEADAVVGHNLKFDIHMIRETLGVDIAGMGKELHDTEIASRVLHPQGAGGRGHRLKDLDPLCKEYEQELEQIARDLKISLKSTPQAYWIIYQERPLEMIKYAVQDARATFDLHVRFHA